MQLDYKKFLSSYHPVSDEDFGLLFNELRRFSVKKGEPVLAEGKVQKELLFVFEGVQMAYFTHEGKEHVMMFTYPHSLCAVADSFLYQKPSEYTIKALTNSQFGAISFEKLNQLFDKSQQLERLFRKMVEAQLCGLVLRHKEFHAYTIEERFRHFTKRSAHLFQLVPHKYIANYLKIEPTNFSKLYNSICI